MQQIDLDDYAMYIALADLMEEYGDFFIKM